MSTPRAKVFHTKAFDRQRLEKYYTPEWATEALLRHVDVAEPGWTWEPAAGDGAIAHVLQAHGARCVASDVAPDYPGAGIQDFFASSVNAQGTPRVTKIITNPPFGTGGRLAFQFCWHALRLMQPVNGTVAMLLRDDFDSAGGRQELFKNNRAFLKKIVLTERIRWTNLPQKAAGPSGSHAWFIWSWQRHTVGTPPFLVYEGREP